MLFGTLCVVVSVQDLAHGQIISQRKKEGGKKEKGKKVKLEHQLTHLYTTWLEIALTSYPELGSIAFSSSSVSGLFRS
jgi:hypothetical protein